MLRTATRPRWLGLLVVAVLLLAAGIQLGRWQWQVAHDSARAEAVREIQGRPVRPIAEVLAPHAAFPDEGSGQRVRTTGRYAAGDQLLVVDRYLEGREGMWVVDRFVVDSTGANLPVVRGWVPAGGQAPPAPSGAVELVGSLAPGEAPDTGGQPAGRVTSVDLARLVNEWPGDLYNAFAFAVTEDGAVPATGLQVVPPPLPDTSLNLRNAMYAAQWWVFGLFALWMWWRMVRQAHERETGGAEPIEAGEPMEQIKAAEPTEAREPTEAAAAPADPTFDLSSDDEELHRS